jgi:TolA-binding protein
LGVANLGTAQNNKIKSFWTMEDEEPGRQEEVPRQEQQEELQHQEQQQQEQQQQEQQQQPHPNGDAEDMIGSAALRPVFLGNLKNDYASADVSEIFTRPIAPPGTPAGTYSPIPVDRVDLKKGYCFVFLKDAVSQKAKEQAEHFVAEINGM